MTRQGKFRIPRVTTPATIYFVHWIDANHDQDYEGDAAGFKATLLDGYHVGYHVKTTKDAVVLAAEAEVMDGVNRFRYAMTLPRVHVRRMVPWGDAPSIMESDNATEESGAGAMGGGGVSRIENVVGEVRRVQAPRKGVHEGAPEARNEEGEVR